MRNLALALALALLKLLAWSYSCACKDAPGCTVLSSDEDEIPGPRWPSHIQHSLAARRQTRVPAPARFIILAVLLPRDEAPRLLSAVLQPRGPRHRPVACQSLLAYAVQTQVPGYPQVLGYQVPPTPSPRHVMRTITVSCSCDSSNSGLGSGFSRSCSQRALSQPSEHSSNVRDPKRRWIIFPSTASEMAAPEFMAESLPRTRCCASSQPCQTSARRASSSQR